jgi:hypothetical protein
LSSGVKRPGREADYLCQSSADGKNGGAILPLPHKASWRVTSLIKHKDIFFLSSAIVTNLYRIGRVVTVSAHLVGRLVGLLDTLRLLANFNLTSI